MKTPLSVVLIAFFLTYCYSNVENYNIPSNNSEKNKTEKEFVYIKEIQDSSEEETSSSSDNPGPVRDAGNMFNERGYYKSNGFSFDEQAIVNDFNGNLMYNIPLYNYKLPGELVFDVSLTYNGAVGHVFNLGSDNTYITKTWKYSMNSPEWIISIDGIAIQVLNFESNFFSKSNGGTLVHRNDVHSIIPGYHYGNILSEITDKPDIITILAGDGSVISLMNEVNNSYIGNYVYLGKDLFYKARVTYADTLGAETDQPRRIELMKGDGLIFIFEESKLQFSDFNLEGLVPHFKRPRAPMLKYIRDRYGNTISFFYTVEHPFLLSNIYGRPLLNSIGYNLGFSTNPTNSINFIYGKSVLKIDHQSEINGGYTIRYDEPVAFTPIEGSTSNHKGLISQITNVLNQTSYIKYSGYVRTFSNVKNPVGYSLNLKVSFNNLKRLSNFKNTLGGRKGYTYYESDSLGVTLAQYYDDDSPIRSPSPVYDLSGYGRDPFYSNMLSSIKDTSETGVPISRDTIVYYYDDIGSPDNEQPVDTSDAYSTTRLKSNRKPGTSWDISESQSKINKYKVYPLYDPSQPYPLDIKDVSGITKLIREDLSANSNSSYIINTYKYELGTGSLSNGFEGSFLLNEKKTTCTGVTKTTTLSYEYYDPGPPPDFDTDELGNLSTDLVLRSTETDPLNNVTKNWFSYCLYAFEYPVYNTTDSEGIYYKINLPDSIAKYRPSNVLTYSKGFSYISMNDISNSSGYPGQLVSEKVYNINSLSDFIETQYQYYKGDTVGLALYGGIDNLPKKEGNLKLITNPNGQIQKYFYHLIDPSESDTGNSNSDFPNYPRFFYKIKYNNGTILDSAEMIYDRRLPIRIDNYKISGGDTITLSKVYKTYTADGSPAKLIDQNRYLTEFKYEPLHRINSITLPGDFSTSKDSIIYVVRKDSLDVINEIQSDSWGNYSVNNSKTHYLNSSQTQFLSCSPNNLNMIISPSENVNQYAYIKLANNIPRKYLSIDSAVFSFYVRTFTARYNGSALDQNDYKSYVKGITDLNNPELDDGCTYWHNRPSTLSNYSDTVNLPYKTNCAYDLRKANVKSLFYNLGNQQKVVRGLTISSAYTGIIIDPELDAVYLPHFDLEMAYCDSFPDNSWYYNYRPKVVIHGTLDISDTLKIPVIKGGTIKYTYNDTDHTVKVYSVRNTLTNERSKVKYSIDGFGNVKQKDIYTDESNSNTYRYKFNYLNKPAVNFDALSDSTNFSYDGLERLIRTKNADTSSTYNTYSYHNNFSNYFGSVPSVVEMQRFTDEEGNPFDKYFDAVGNLRREVKYLEVSLNEEFPSIPLITDYKYDSLYRVTQVRTPEGKNIYYSYDGYSRQTKRITPDAGQTDFIYDKNSNLTYSQDANQRYVSGLKYTFRNYDGLNRLTGVGERIFDADAPSDGGQSNESSQSYYLTVNVYDTISNYIVNIFSGVNNYSGLNYTKGNLAATAYRTKTSDSWNFKYYRYDVRGRVIKLWNIISDFDTLITDYYYNSQDQITIYSHSGHGDAKTYRNTYDYTGRLYKVDWYTGYPDTPYPGYTNLTEYRYTDNSQVSQQLLNEGGIKNNYYYTNRNWIYSMQNNDGMFEYTNDYFKNGNVKSQEILGNYNNSFSFTSDLYFNYTYDRSNRLLKGTISAGKSYEIENTYDKDGNILTLKRYDYQGNYLDNFNYSYTSGTNKLRKVSGSADQYTYDQNGNMTSDEINRNKNIKYDHRNLITELRHKELVHEDSIVYVTYYNYDEAGNRIAKTVYRYTDSSEPSDTLSEEDVSISSSWELYKAEIYSRDVSGRELAVYKDNAIEEYPLYGLDMIGKLKNDIPYYYYKDHLGSVRAIVNATNDLISAQDFDQWGYIMQGRTYESDDSKFKFTGKERDEENKYDYFGARYYDSRIGRWGSVEPLQEKYVSFSPYSYALTNPLKLNDITGLGPKITIEGNYINIEFNVYYTTATDDAVHGLNEKQISVLNYLQADAQKEFTGIFNINGEDYNFSTSVNLIEESGTFGEMDARHNTEGYYNFAMNASNESEQTKTKLEGTGLGASGNTLLMLEGLGLRPYKSTGAHEFAHLMGLVDIQDDNKPIPSLMQRVKVVKYNKSERELRNKPGEQEFKEIFNRNSLGFKQYGTHYINY